MAKDKGGHGSEKRGVSAVQARNDRMFGMFERAKAQGHNTFNAAADAANGAPFGADQKYNRQITPGGWVVPRGSDAAKSGGGQPVASNAHAAATLASGPKSAPVDTHPAMGLPKGVTMVSMGDPGKMHNAIARAVGEGPLPNDISQNAWKSRGRGK